jgi:hypothetical protein
VSALCPTSSGTFTPAQPIHLASNSFRPAKNFKASFSLHFSEKRIKTCILKFKQKKKKERKKKKKKRKERKIENVIHETWSQSIEI